MKYGRTLVLTVAALLLIGATAMAGDMNKTSMTLIAPAAVSGKTLPAGNYEVTWEGSGQVQVSILFNGKVVATSAATVQARPIAPADTALVTTKKGDSLVLTEIRPEGRKEALVLNAGA